MTYKQASFKEDNKLGMKAEKKYIKYLLKKYDLIVYKLSPFHFGDFICKEKRLLFELKRRNNNRCRYPHTIIGYDKVQRFRRFNQKKGGIYLFIMVFHFNDGIYFFEHREDYKYLIKPYVRHKRIDYDDKKKDYIFIPVNQLEPMENIKRYTESKNLIIRYNVR